MRDSLGNLSNTLSLATFGVDTTGPEIFFSGSPQQILPGSTAYQNNPIAVVGFKVGVSINAAFSYNASQSSYSAYIKLNTPGETRSLGYGTWSSGFNGNSVELLPAGHGASGVFSNWSIFAESELGQQSPLNYLPDIVIAHSIFTVTKQGYGNQYSPYVWSISKDGSPLGNNPTLTLKEGEVYIFDINGAYGHPFLIKTQNSTGTGNRLFTGIQEYGSDYFVFIVPQNPGYSTLYYNCQHHSTMAGIINITS